MEYKNIPQLLKEVWSMNLKASVEDSYGKAVLLVEKNEQYDSNASTAIKLIAKQKQLLTFDLPKYVGLV